MSHNSAGSTIRNTIITIEPTQNDGYIMRGGGYVYAYPDLSRLIDDLTRLLMGVEPRPPRVCTPPAGTKIQPCIRGLDEEGPFDDY